MTSGDAALNPAADAAKREARGTGIVLATLAAGQFLMTLDSSVMNVSIATVAKDVGTDVTGIQTAITLYTLVMASLMITGGKIGQIVGRKRAFSIGCVIYGCGSLTTALSPSLGVLILGWSFLEGVGAALILPAIVALVASNFAPVGTATRVRAGRLGGRDRGRGGAAHRRAVHDLSVLAVGVRLRGTGRDRHSCPGPPDGGHDSRDPGEARPGGDRAVGARAGADRVRNPPLGGVGVHPA